MTYLLGKLSTIGFIADNGMDLGNKSMSVCELMLELELNVK